ncbi:hypothetical protein FRC00_010065 [Tulasnella sp. 408]|nr:hypothetical protein FRC00_010065 [Tulasnella sp. 408]
MRWTGFGMADPSSAKCFSGQSADITRQAMLDICGAQGSSLSSLLSKWEGSGGQEVGKVVDTGKVVVSVDLKYFRPAEVDFLHGNLAKAEKKLGWKRKWTVDFNSLVKEMTEGDRQAAANLVEDCN